MWVLYLFVVLLIVVLGGLLSTHPKRKSFDLRGAHVLITGGSSGIGLSLADLLVKNEAIAKISLVARNAEKLAVAKEQLSKVNPAVKIFTISLDVSDAVAVEKTLEAHVSEHGIVDVLVNSAGITCVDLFEKASLKQFERTMNVNYLGTVYPTKILAPYMIKQNHGSIIFIDSVAGQIGVYGYAAYTPTKFAVRGLAEVLYQELVPYDNVSIGVAYPPDTDTPMLHEENKTKSEVTKKISEGAGLFTAEEVAAGVVDMIKTRSFSMVYGFEGKLVHALSLGSAPPSTITESILSITLGPIARFAMMVYYQPCLLYTSDAADE
eukprot:TRINITY_DN14018_c0_g1_i1.p1 TRINITY_DN14018_c0_g1~~TRINITY_DN14018_c0_g1_i1.p1  ORF type:complete len:322 (-),score=45.34 TRINITY_DN14018_c0_g1_i1:29-994(-)